MTNRHATILGFLVLMLAFAFPSSTQAALLRCEKGITPKTIQEEGWVRLQVPIPTVTVTCTDDNDTPADTRDDVERSYVKDLGQYIGGLYKYFVGVIGIIAALMVFYGGLRWLTAGGNASKVKEAKETVFAALIAILIAFGSYTLLYTINPKLVQLNPPVLKVADTFLGNSDSICPTQKVCLSGTNVGNPCTAHTSCPGASTGEGACGLPFEDAQGNTPTVATCGQRYTYKKILGVQFPSESCIGSYCDAIQFTIGGTEQPVCTSNKNRSLPPTEEDHICTTPGLACESVAEPSQSECSARSIPGKGKCRFVDKALYNIFEDDACIWSPPLTCDKGFAQVGCDACVTHNKTCERGILEDGLLEYILDNTRRICESDAGIVYRLDLASDGESLRSICCQKLFCMGGNTPGQACEDSSTCGTGTCEPYPDYPSRDASEFKCITSRS